MMKTIESVLQELTQVLESRKGGDPERSYVSRLFAKGDDTILKKVGEECVEVVIAAKSGNSHQIVYESADLLFHLMVMLSNYNLHIEDVVAELARREGMSGLVEKAARKEISLE
ncbi:MAG: phosphoribosyl-ATP diphosphatase [Formosimonas sp.]